MPVNMLPINESDGARMAELDAIIASGLGNKRPPERLMVHESYAQRMRDGMTKSTRHNYIPEPPRPATLTRKKQELTRQCFCCGAWVWCEHREPELVGRWKGTK